MKTTVLTFLIFCLSSATSPARHPVEKVPFSLTVITFNHAEMMGKGKSVYCVSGNRLEVSKIAFNHQKRLVLSKELSGEILEKFAALDLDSLRHFYSNDQVMITSGNEMYVQLQKDGQTKEIHLHHYYNEQIGAVISLLNEQIPADFAIRYNENLNSMR